MRRMSRFSATLLAVGHIPPRWTGDIFNRYLPSAALTFRADPEINLCDVLAADVPCLTGPVTMRQ